MDIQDFWNRLPRRWPPSLAQHQAIVHRYLLHLFQIGFGHRQIRFIRSNIIAFLAYFFRQSKDGLESVSPCDIDHYFRQTPYRLHTDHGKARQTYVRRFLAFALPHRSGDFQKPPRFRPSPPPFGPLGRSFLDFNRLHRGLKDSTLKFHRDVLTSFETFLAHRKIRHLRRLSLAQIDSFFMAHSKRLSPAAQKSVIGTLRHFFRFLYVNGHLRTNWSDRLPRPSLFHKSLRPKYFFWNQIESFLNSIDRSSPLGKRDYTLALLMATLGLRAREVALLRVRDVDLKHRQIFLPERKGGRPDLFPLSPALAAALRDYLSVRPSAPFEELFLSVRPPVKPLGREVRTTVATRLARHFGRPRSMRVYLLRHSFAKRLLDNGAPLPDIAAVLGHRSLSSTLIYTRVDTRSLREVADNYADLLPPPPGLKDW